jgi:hypothetical protein
MTPCLLIKYAVVAFVPLAAVAVLWPVITRPWLLRQLLADQDGMLSIGRLQMLLVSAPAVVATVGATNNHANSLIAAIVGLSNAGYLVPKFLGARAQSRGDDQ